jgi:hypothetical protein
MLQLRRSLRTVSAATALSLVLVACGTGEATTDPEPGDDTTATQPDEGGDAPDDMNQDQDGGPDTAAASLRATLTAGLQEHVYLAGIAVVEALTNGLESPEFSLAANTLDLNSQALAGAIDSVYNGAGDPFLELWRNHIGFFVNYTVGVATGDDAMANQAKADLDEYRADFGAFVAGANPNLPADAVADALVPHTETVFAAIDAVAGVSGEDPFQKLREAAAVMPGIAAVLSGGIAAQFPDTFTGQADGPGADLRATLTAGLQEHVYLAGIAVVMGVRNGPDSGEFELAAGALDGNSQDIAAAVDSVYNGAGEPFLELWRSHIGFFVNYTLASAGGDEAGAQQARDDLAEYRSDFGAFIAGANPNLPADAVADALVPHTDTVFAAIDAVLGSGDNPFLKLQEAAAVMPGIAEVLAGAIAAQFPEQFS